MTNNAFPLTLFYDGRCPVCSLEMHALRDRDLAQHCDAPLLRLIDISEPGFDAVPDGATLPAMNALIHAQRPDGSLVIGVEVFRLAYGAVGLGHWWAPTAWGWLKPLADRGYEAFAAHRYGISRTLAPLIHWIAARRALKASQACYKGFCNINERSRS